MVGETAELKDLIDYSRRFRIGLIAITAVSESTLGRAADVVLAVPPAREACPHNLAPTTSTLMQAALGDALAIALLESRGFTAIDFGRLASGRAARRNAQIRARHHAHRRRDPARRGRHPHGGGDRRDDAKTFGCVGITDAAGRLVGIITDGDLRRHMSGNLLDLAVEEVMTPEPRTVAGSARQRGARAAQLDQEDAADRGRGRQAGRRRAFPRPVARRRGRAGGNRTANSDQRTRGCSRGPRFLPF